MNDAPPVTKSVSEGFYEIVAALCENFTGLSPFEVMNSDLKDVYDLYVDVAIYSFTNRNKNNKNGSVWVTSKTATWH